LNAEFNRGHAADQGPAIKSGGKWHKLVGAFFMRETKNSVRGEYSIS